MSQIVAEKKKLQSDLVIVKAVSHRLEEKKFHQKLCQYENIKKYLL